MSKRKHEEHELPFVALMDTMTNVVGVLIIVLVMVGLSVANVVKTVLSDLPPVTPEELAQIRDQSKLLPKLKTPEQIEEEKKKAETDLKKIIEELKTVDTSELESKMKAMDLETYKKQLEDRTKEREAQKAATEKLLAEVERLKALLDQTPVYQPPPPKFVHLPNPRPFPEKPNETRILVAKQGVLSFNQPKFVQPILDGMEKVKSQLEYQRVEFAPFAKLLETILGPSANQAWTHIAPLVEHMQIDQVAQAYKILADGGIAPTKQILESVADISMKVKGGSRGAAMPATATAIVAATKGNLEPWKALDPTTDPLTPFIKAAASNGKITFTWRTSPPVVVKTNPKDVSDYFFKDLGKAADIKDARTKVGANDHKIYDMARIVSLLQRAAANPLLSGSYTFEPKILPTEAYVQLALTPKSGGGETIDAIKQPNSAFIRLMRDVKQDPNGVVVFQVMPDAFESYLEARKLADEVGVPATWEFLAKLDLTVNLTTYEVQRLALTAPRKPAADGTVPVTIAPPKKTLD